MTFSPKIVRKKNSKILVIRGDKDKMFSTKEIEAVYGANYTNAIIINNIGHDCMLDSNWRIVADIIFEWLNIRINNK